MSLSTNKIILSGAQSNTAGAYFLTTTVTSTSTGNGTVIPAGVYIMFPQANTSVVAYNGSSNATVIAANTGGVIISDGVNVYAKSTATADTVTLLATNGGQNVSSTYAS
jgi:3D (Asp-Asp-Asp) domain-containing protein